MSKQYYWAVFLKMGHPENKEQYIKNPRNEDAQEGKVSFWTDENVTKSINKMNLWEKIDKCHLIITHHQSTLQSLTASNQDLT